MRQAKLKCIEKLKQIKDEEEEVDYKNMGFVNDGLEVKLSTLPNAGRGVFVTRDFLEDQIVCEYSGKVTSIYTFFQHFQYRAQLGKEYTILGNPHESINPGCLINDAKDATKTNCCLYFVPIPSAQLLQYARLNNTGRKVNCRLFVVAKKDISVGSELFLSYGKDYWNHHEQGDVPP